MARRVLVIGLLAVSAVAACSKEDSANLVARTVDAAPPPAGPTSLDLAKGALVTAKAKYAKHEAGDADCAPLKSFEADFAKDKSPDAVKTKREIDVFCDIDVKLEGGVATLEKDNDKLTAAVKKKDKTTEQMYAATVKDGCASIKQQLETLAQDHLDGEPKVATLKARIDPICSAPAAAKK
ncbi:MAG: hypothetical protein JWP87_4228 [Labilithrix sp.]|nr:hypothetical protein [Labilithrix sp.]